MGICSGTGPGPALSFEKVRVKVSVGEEQRQQWPDLVRPPRVDTNQETRRANVVSDVIIPAVPRRTRDSTRGILPP